MRYFTAKGDSGTTKLFDCPPGARVGKDDPVFEALGALDELNSFVGLCRARATREVGTDTAVDVSRVLLGVQENLFILQAELAGADKNLPPDAVAAMERAIDDIAGKFPPITSFVLPGATDLSALLDICRTLARRAERQAIRQKTRPLPPLSLSYLNRLSSLLYVLARYANHALGKSEQFPSY